MILVGLGGAVAFCSNVRGHFANVLISCRGAVIAKEARRSREYHRKFDVSSNVNELTADHKLDVGWTVLIFDGDWLWEGDVNRVFTCTGTLDGDTQKPSHKQQKGGRIKGRPKVVVIAWNGRLSVIEFRAPTMKRNVCPYVHNCDNIDHKTHDGQNMSVIPDRDTSSFMSPFPLDARCQNWETERHVNTYE